MINTKSIFKNILRQWGHDVLLQRRLSDDGMYSDKFEKVTTRHVTAASRYLASTKEEQIEGLLVGSDRIYYFESSVNPKAGDRLYEESSSNLEDYSLFLIEECYPVRGKSGRIDFWTVGASKEEDVS